MAGFNEPKLEDLFSAYRAALPDRDASPGFTPELWAKIDQRRKHTYSFRRFGRRLVTAAAALCCAMTIVSSWSPSKMPSFYSASYVEILDDDTHDLDQTRGEML